MVSESVERGKRGGRQTTIGAGAERSGPSSGPSSGFGPSSTASSSTVGLTRAPLVTGPEQITRLLETLPVESQLEILTELKRYAQSDPTLVKHMLGKCVLYCYECSHFSFLGNRFHHLSMSSLCIFLFFCYHCSSKSPAFHGIASNVSPIWLR